MQPSVPAVARVLPLAALASLGSALVADPVMADSTLSTRADAVIFGNGPLIRETDTTAPTANVSVTGSGTSTFGVPYSGSATAFLDASNYGDLRISGEGQMTGQAQASALSTINIQDTLTFSVDSLTGQLGLWTFSLLVDGSLSDTTSNAPNAVQSGWQVDIHARMTSGAGQSSNYFHNVADWADTPGTPFSRCNIDGVATSDYTDCASLFTISIPFTFGTPFDFFYQFRGSATSSPDTAVHVGDAVYDLSNSLLWGGTSSITAGGIVVTNYGFHSDSGFDWRQSSIPTNGIPEPASIALIGIGLAALAWTTRRSPEA